MRVLGRIRLSRLTDESTSAARQREIIEQWATIQGHDVIGWAEDLDVSGSVDPFDTPSLGPWLKERSAEWDILCAWKLDRIGRRAIPLNKLFGWTLDNGKVLVCVSDNIDLSTWVGRLVANVIAGVAEGELEAIRERTKASRKALLESGRWPGGKPPYGLKAAPVDGGGWRLVADPATAPVVQRIVQEVTEGSPIDAVVRGLNADGVLSPRGGLWRKKSVWQIVTSRYFLGHATYEGQTVRDRSGEPVCNAEPLLTAQQWDALQSAVASRKNNPSRSYKVSPLLGVILCAECVRPMHHRVHVKGGKEYRYYYCPDNHSGTISAAAAEEQLELTFIEAVGDDFVTEKVFRQAENHQIELDEAKRAVDELSTLFGTITSDTMRSRLTEQMRALDFRIATLEKLPTRESGWEYRQTDKTYKETWDNADTEQRRQLLLRSGITYRIKRTAGTQTIESHLYVPEEILDLLKQKNPPTQ